MHPQSKPSTMGGVFHCQKLPRENPAGDQAGSLYPRRLTDQVRPPHRRTAKQTSRAPNANEIPSPRMETLTKQKNYTLHGHRKSGERKTPQKVTRLPLNQNAGQTNLHLRIHLNSAPPPNPIIRFFVNLPRLLIRGRRNNIDESLLMHFPCTFLLA